MPLRKGNPLKILQLSDSHISAVYGADYRGQNADQNLERLIPAMCAWNPDLLLLSGDISEDASPASYSRVAAMLTTLAVPVLALPGNHDLPEEMKRHFPQGPWRGPLVHQSGPWSLVLMDSTAPGCIAGSFNQNDLDGLDKLLQKSSSEFILVGLHHQPVPVNAPWIDRYGLENPASFFETVDRDERVGCITWGHIHHDFRVIRNGAALLGAPSAAANSLPATQRFTLDPDGPGCRWLELGVDGTVKTGVLRPDQSSTGNTIQRIR